MATSTGLSILITAKNEASGALDAVRKSLGQLADGARNTVNKGLDPIRNLLATGLKAAAVGATAAIGGLVGLAGKSIALAAGFEQTEVAFATMLGSADKAKNLMKDLFEFSAKTPFQFAEVSAAAKSLMAFGVSAEDVKDTLRRLGDVAAGINAPVGEIAEIYGKAKVQGRLFAEDINQLTGRGIPIIQELAKVLGVTEGEVKAMVEAGKVGFPELEKAFQGMTDKGGKFAGMMEAQSQTLAGLWSSLKDNVELALAGIGKSLVENLDLKEVLAVATEWIGKFGARIQELVETWLPPLILNIKALISYVSALVQSGEPATDWLAQMSPAVADVTRRVTEFILGIKALLQPIIDLVARFISWKDVVVAAAGIIATIAIPALYGLVAAYAPVLAVIGGAIAIVSTLRNAWEVNFGGIRTLVQITMDYLQTRFGALYETIRQFGGGALREIIGWAAGTETQFNSLSLIWERARATAQTLFNDLVAMVQRNLPLWLSTLSGWGVAAWQWIQGAATVALTKLGEWATVLGNWIVANLPAWISKLSAWGAALWGWVAPMIGPALTKLGEWATALGNWIVANLPAWGAKLAVWGAALWQWIVTVTPTVLAKLGEWLGALGGWLVANLPAWGAKLLSWGAALWGWIIEAIPLALSKLGEWLVALKNWVVNNAGGWGMALLGWGAALWRWIIDAVPLALGKLGEWLGSLGSWLLENYPKWLAAVYRWQAGLWQWIADSLPGVIRAFTDWVLGITDWSKSDGSSKFGEMMRNFGNAMVTEVWPAMKELLIAMKNAFVAVMPELIEAAAKIGVAIIFAIAQGLLNMLGINVNLMEVRNTILNGLNGIGPAVFGAAANIGRSFLDGIASMSPVGSLNGMVDGVINSFNGKMDGFKTHVRAVAGSIGDFMSEGLRAINAAASMAPPLDAIINTFNSVMGGFKTHTKAVVMEVGQNMAAAMGGLNLGGAMYNALRGIIDAFNGVMDSFKNHVLNVLIEIGQKVGEGLKEGIKRSVQWVIDGLRWITDMLPQWVRDALGIHSPSQVFMDIGENIIAGLTKGIENMRLEPQLALAGAVEPMMAGASQTTINRNDQRTYNFALPSAASGDQDPIETVRSLTALYGGVH